MTAHRIYYAIEFEACACPSFCSFSKSFHGRLSDIKGLMAALAEDNEKGYHDEILKAFRAWEQGASEVTHRVAHREHRLLTAEEFIACKVHTVENAIWKHTNIWGSIHELKADTVKAIRDLTDETKIDFAVVMEELFGDG